MWRVKVTSCSVSYVTDPGKPDQHETILPECDNLTTPKSSTNQPCWAIVNDPANCMLGTHDSLVPVVETRRFVEKLRDVSHAPVAYAELPGGQHAFDVFPSIRTAHVTRAAERFCDHVYSLAHEREAELQPDAS